MGCVGYPRVKKQPEIDWNVQRNSQIGLGLLPGGLCAIVAVVLSPPEKLAVALP